MYTQCPQCETAFKVTAEQLQAAGGRVRCGKCETVFNAVAHLSDGVSLAAAGSRHDLTESARKEVTATAPVSDGAVERRVHERRRWAPAAEANTTADQSSQTAVLAQFLSEPLAEPGAIEPPTHSNKPPSPPGDLAFDAAAEMTAVEADGTLEDLSWLEPAPSQEAAPPPPDQEDVAAQTAPEGADEAETAGHAAAKHAPPEPSAGTDEAGDELGFSEEDWDQLLFDDDHGIQEYLEEKKAKAQKPPPGEEPAGHENASVAPPQAPPATPIPAQAPEAAPAAEPETQSADENFEEAVEALLTSLTDDESAAATESTPPTEEDISSADESPAFSLDELSLVEEEDAPDVDGSAAGDDAAAPEAAASLTPPAGEEVVMADESSAREAAAEAVDPSAEEGDDDPLSRAGSEDYAFSLYHEMEKQAVSSPDDEDERSDDQSEVALDDDSATGENLALTKDDSSSPANGETEMLEFPLEEAVEFEIPMDEYGDNTTVMANDLNEAESAIRESDTIAGTGKESLDVLDADLKRRPRTGRGLYWGGATLLLVFVLAVQLAHYNRDALVLHPTFGPWLQAAYGAIGMTLVPPGDLDQYDIRLHVAPAIEGTIQISATLSNKADHVQPYPLVRLVLEDRWQEPVGALIVEPADYLAQAANANGLMAPRERVEAQIEVIDPGPDAQSYKLDVCLRHTQGRLLCADDS